MIKLYITQYHVVFCLRDEPGLVFIRFTCIRRSMIVKRRIGPRRCPSPPWSAQSLWRSSPLINTALHLCSCSERRSFTAPCCVNYQVFPMSPLPRVLHSLPHLNFLTRLEQIRSHTGSRRAGRK